MEEIRENKIEGRNAVMEAFRSGRAVDKVFVLDGCQDGPVRSIVREAKKHDTVLNFVSRERLDRMSETGKHQGVIAFAASYDYSTVEDILALAKRKANRRLSCCWTASRTRIIWERLSVPRIWRARMESSFRSAVPWA